MTDYIAFVVRKDNCGYFSIMMAFSIRTMVLPAKEKDSLMLSLDFDAKIRCETFTFCFSGIFAQS
jgi:hypothetical protein